MKIEHLAIWVKDLEKMRSFYSTYFNAISTEKYTNTKKGFSSYFLSFEGACRLEIMHRNDIVGSIDKNKNVWGFAHFSISSGSRSNVDQLTEKLRMNGYNIVGEARVTGDGYYESVIEDPEGNLVEITE